MIPKLRMHRDALARFVQRSKLIAALLVGLVAASIGKDLYAADMFKGKQLYSTHCAVCHGQNGISRMPGAPNFARQEGILKPDFTLLSTIRSGRNAMPAFQGMLSDRDIMDAIAYIRTLN
ncbi:MAG TPA: cytochrome c [Noviherbaspirillum sp.]